MRQRQGQTNDLGELPAGFKWSEAGVIPADWTVGPLSLDISALEAGVSVNSVDDDSVSLDAKCILKTSAIAGGAFLDSERKTIAPEDLWRARITPKADTILVSRMNTPDLVGDSAYVSKDYPQLYLPDRLWMTRVRADSDVCVRWLAYVLSSGPYKRRLKVAATGTSGSMKNISKQALLAMPVARPNSDEQVRIATALSDIDAWIAALARLEGKKSMVLQGATQELLFGRRRLPGFKDGWKQVTVGEVGRLRGGAGFPLHYQGHTHGKYPFFKVSDMNTRGNEVVMTRAAHWISDEVRKALSATALPRLTIVFAKVGGAVFLERKRLLGQPSCVDNNMMGLVVDTGIADPEWVHAWLTNFRMSDLVATTALPALNAKEVAAITLGLPSLSEQRAVARVLSDMKLELTMLSSELDKARAIKHGAMQALLTGRIRLPAKVGA